MKTTTFEMNGAVILTKEQQKKIFGGKMTDHPCSVVIPQSDGSYKTVNGFCNTGTGSGTAFCSTPDNGSNPYPLSSNNGSSKCNDVLTWFEQLYGLF